MAVNRRFLQQMTFVMSLAQAATVFSADRAELGKLETLLNSGDSQDAWSLAKKMRPAWESDPAFDYLYGAAALASGSRHESIFALERVVLQEPGNTQARFLLAKAYYETGNQEEARKQFIAVRAGNPTAPMLREVERYLGETSVGQDVFNGYVEASVGHDNNVNSATGAGTVLPANGQLIEIDPAARKTSDMYSDTQAGVDYFHPITADTMVEVKGRFAERDNFSSDTYDSTSYRGSVALRHQKGADLYRVTLHARDFRLSDSDYQRTLGLNGDWVHQLTSNTALLANIYTSALRYPEAGDNIRDINQYIGHVGLQITDDALTHTTGILVGDEDALRNKGNNNARGFTAAYYHLRYDINSEHQIFGRIYVQDSHQIGEDPTFLKTRDDTLTQITMGYSWQLDKNWRWKSELGYSDSDSDIDYYSFERTYLQTGVRYSF